MLEVVVPVHNEEVDLEPCVRRLRAHLDRSIPYPARITIADNASTDSTLAMARRLAAELLLCGTLHAGFSDAQRRFKAVRGDVAKRLLPLVQDTGWFFDTELLVLAERSALRIHEVPVDWVDDPDSRVDVLVTAVARPNCRCLGYRSSCTVSWSGSPGSVP